MNRTVLPIFRCILSLCTFSMLMFYIINDLLLLLFQPAPMRSWDENHMTRERATDKLWMGDDSRLRQTQGHMLPYPPFAVACITTAAVITMERGGRMLEADRQGGAAEWQEAGERGSCSTDDQETERERVYPQDVRAGSRGGGGGASRLDGPSDALMEYGPGFRILPLPWVCFCSSVSILS